MTEPDTRGMLAATILASGMAFLIGTAVSIALPTIQADLGTTIAGLQWVVNAYALSLTVFILIGGSLGDILGRKRIFGYGIIIFVVGSVLSGLAGSITWLIVFQGLQGLGGALMVPGSLAIINSSVPREHRGGAIGLWAGYSGGIATLGPFLGGWLVQTLGWRAVFFINVPLGLIALWFTLRSVPESKNPETTGVDWLGAGLMALGLFGLCYGLIGGPLMGWDSNLVRLGLFISVAALVAFVINEERCPDAIVPLRIFRDPLVAGANLMTLFLYFALNGVIFFLVINFQQFQGYPPLKAGMALLPPIVLITLLSGPAGNLADRIGPRKQMVIGPMIVGLGMALFTLPNIGASYIIGFLPGLVLFGAGMALVIAPLTKSALAVDEKYSGVASGVNNSVARMAALLAVAVMGALVVSVFTSQMVASVRASSRSTQEQVAVLSQVDRVGGMEIPASLGEEVGRTVEGIKDRSFLLGFRIAMGLGAFLAFLSSLVAFRVVPKGQGK